ncbi:MAG TPA: FHA domain-containing protein [Blastocatellia bacterium]|nr:FHA domain-containing protein [Blastocatellia bacterium]
MIELIFTKGPMTGVRFAIESDSISIGRLNECDLELNQPDVSRHHAFIKRIGGNLQIIDNNSGNGTFVNGKRVRQAALRDGDEIRIGPNTLRVDFCPDKMTGQEIQVARVKAAQKPTRVEKLSRFIVTDCTSPARRQAEFSSENLTIGRGEKCRLVLDDPEISRLHATIHHRGGSFTLKDSGSANGTFINGERVIEELLESGDLIEMGQAALAVEIIGGVLHLTVTSKAAPHPSGGSELTQVGSARVPPTAPKAAAGLRARDSAAAFRSAQVPPYTIVRVLLTVLAIALLLLFVGKNYAATSSQPDSHAQAQPKLMKARPGTDSDSSPAADKSAQY